MRFKIFQNPKNKNQEFANLIANQAISSVDPMVCVERQILYKKNSLTIGGHHYQLSREDTIHVFGVGKAALAMAKGVLKRIPSERVKGHLIVKHIDNEAQYDLPEKIGISQGDHPIPSLRSVAAARNLINAIKEVRANDVVLFLISGGGSALMTMPADGIRIEQIQELTELLLKSGADIEEINVIRKHLDQVKGGGLLRRIYPAKSVSLILSDVLGDHIPSIASGPTAADPSSYRQAIKILEKYQLKKKVAPSIITHLLSGIQGEVSETVKPGEPELINHWNVIVAGLATAANHAAAEAKRLSLSTKLLSLNMTGEARDVGRQLGDLLKKTAEERKFSKPACLIAGGEPTVTIKGPGKGGRNQEAALAAAIQLQGVENCLFISLATDGEDGPTDAAGGAVDGETIQRGLNLGSNVYDYLKNNDSYHYLQQTQSLIQIGPTGTNVNDLYILIAS